MQYVTSEMIINESSKYLLILFVIIDKNARFDKINNSFFSGL